MILLHTSLLGGLKEFWGAFEDFASLGFAIVNGNMNSLHIDTTINPPITIETY